MLSIATRVALFDAALAAVRQCFRDAGVREVVTPVRVDAVALEPFIEPIRAEGGLLHTSPELAMKRLVAAGAGPIFQIAPVFRRSEQGALHREEFHLVEWYRLGIDTRVLHADVERLVAAVCEAVANVLHRDADDEPAAVPRTPAVWTCHRFIDLVHATTGLALTGTEDAATLTAKIQADAPHLASDPPGGARLAASPRASDLAAWTAFFSTWSDRVLTPWLAARPREGVHVTAFPHALAALSEHAASGLAHRFESHVGAIELANGYRELRDAAEQRARFEAVAALRAALGDAPLPMPDTFLASLADPGLPPCVGAALGLDRLILFAASARSLRDVSL